MHTPQKRMYILCRHDLSDKYGLIQGHHALAQYAIEHQGLFAEWGNHTIAVLGVRNLLELREWNMTLQKKRKTFSMFREIDLDGQETAIACFDDGMIFEDLSSF